MTRRLPPLAALRAFEAAARLGRMTAAADELCVSPGAVSRQVRQLEQHLGLPLFAGTKARPTLTAAARTLQPALTQAFEQIHEAVRSLGDAHEGPLDVACFSTFTVKWLIPRLFDFHAHHPGIEVRLRTTDTGTDAAREGCDLLITAITHDSGEALADNETFLPLFAEYLGPVMSPAMAGRLQQPEDLASLPLLHTRGRRDAWDLWAASMDIAAPAAAGPVYEHYYFTLEAALRGLGAAVAPWHLVMDDVQAGRLLAPFGFTASGYRYLALRRSTAVQTRLDIFCNWLQAQARAMPEAPAVQGISITHAGNFAATPKNRC
ncbi:LysR substrate-binding domain-containing protein [Delftia tsuruhatensis]|uniref:LysR substrate-binding domain-containing protein n=1 Tax=Delftia tsuruhatensis TaxID=180282 RepID=UPI002444ED33|nr:LysR substrate-binding domain-containing protein [Delftia tsuruhatensis]MDH0772555.1 LysR substrate-binding domain-containing protein [Delftia tsuruhatensis]MDH1456968.1 LysR substrate-binding domain-containing protein [Delftia tsuruhatensis]MDH1821761.1 LysR substrate-binding domain-containing protein [Delftia tsuruhatensis]WGG08734.1 LysR substrate-binding domain-containing protein [Delftia tsuruhatensis]